MAITLAQIWRHPIKSHGREALTSVKLSPDQALPFDRRWAVTHELAKTASMADNWLGYVNFIRGAISPSHCAITARFDEDAGTILLAHPEHGETPPLNPDRDGEAIVEFSKRVAGDLGRTPTAVISSQSRGFTDTDYPSVSILNLASLAVLENFVGAPMGTERWRGNLWIDGWAPWAEADMIGQRIAIGDTELEIIEPIVRCRVTETDATRGAYDFETRRLLREMTGTDNFGVYARVVAGGQITIGERVN